MKKIVSYLMLTTGLTWGIWLLVWLLGVRLGEPISLVALMVGMWMPSLSYGLLRKFKPEQFSLGTSFSIQLKRDWKVYLLALWLPAILTMIGTGLYFLVFPNQFAFLAETVKQVGSKGQTPPLAVLALTQILSALTLAPVLNIFVTLGEEIGWRGFLYPAFRQYYSPLKSHLLVALIWSLWHLPINLQGYNFGLVYWGAPWMGVLAMFFFCFSLQVLLSWVMEKTDSIWVAALLHGSVNANAGLGLLFQLPSMAALHSKILGPSPVGLLAGLPLFLVALIFLFKGRRRES